MDHSTFNKITHLYAVGDSFAFGQGLSACVRSPTGHLTFTEGMKNTVFSGIISKKLGIRTYINAASPGASNDRTQRLIFRDIPGLIDTGVNPANIFTIINITHSARFEIFSNSLNNYVQMINNNAPSQNDEIKKYWDLYVAYFDNVVENVDRYLIHITSMQQFLDHLGVKYLMINSMGESPEFYKALGNRGNSIKKCINRKTYPQISAFNDWARMRGFQPTPCYHVGDDAHEAWADYLLEYIIENKLLENT